MTTKTKPTTIDAAEKRVIKDDIKTLQKARKKINRDTIAAVKRLDREALAITKRIDITLAATDREITQIDRRLAILQGRL